MEDLQKQIDELRKRIESLEGVPKIKTPNLDHEAELVQRFFKPNRDGKKWTVSDVCDVIRIETGEELFVNKVGRAIKIFKWERRHFRRNGEIRQGYALTRI